MVNVNGPGGINGPEFDPKKKKLEDEQLGNSAKDKATGPTEVELSETHGIPSEYSQYAMNQFAGNQAVEGAEETVPANLDEGLGVDGIQTASSLDFISQLSAEDAANMLQNPEVKEALLSGNPA